MKRTIIRHKALFAAASVVLAMGCGDKDVAIDSGVPANQETGVQDSGTDSGNDTSTDTGDKPDCSTAEDIVACCETLSAWCADEYPDDDEAMNECIFGPGFDGSTGCIPWGPPVPPKSVNRLA